MDNYLIIAATIVTVAGVIIAYFNVEQDKYEELKKEYFTNVLEIFFAEYVKNNNIDVVNNFNQDFTNRPKFIPSYIYYLIRENENEKLKKVLIIDYIESYPSLSNNISNTLDKFIRRFAFLESIVYIIVMLMCILMSLQGILGCIDYLKSYYLDGISGTMTSFGVEMSPIIFYSLYIVLAIIFIGILKFTLDNVINSIDEYSLKRKTIQSIVNKKVKKYNKKYTKYYI